MSDKMLAFRLISKRRKTFDVFTIRATPKNNFVCSREFQLISLAIVSINFRINNRLSSFLGPRKLIKARLTRTKEVRIRFGSHETWINAHEMESISEENLILHETICSFPIIHMYSSDEASATAAQVFKRSLDDEKFEIFFQKKEPKRSVCVCVVCVKGT